MDNAVAPVTLQDRRLDPPTAMDAGVAPKDLTTGTAPPSTWLLLAHAEAASNSVARAGAVRAAEGCGMHSLLKDGARAGGLSPKSALPRRRAEGRPALVP